MEAPKTTLERPRRSALRKAPGELLPVRVQKSYFMLSSAERDLLNTALEKLWPGLHEPLLVGGLNRLKTALKLMGVYRLVIEEVQDARAMTSYPGTGAGLKPYWSMKRMIRIFLHECADPNLGPVTRPVGRSLFGPIAATVRIFTLALGHSFGLPTA
jgi:hypothetical protein